jgi:hypothetical protein
LRGAPYRFRSKARARLDADRSPFRADQVGEPYDVLAGARADVDRGLAGRRRQLVEHPRLQGLYGGPLCHHIQDHREFRGVLRLRVRELEAPPRHVDPGLVRLRHHTPPSARSTSIALPCGAIDVIALPLRCD